MFANYICTVDIGSTKIAAAVAGVKNNTLTGIYLESMPSNGVKNGIIVDSIRIVESLGVLLKRLKAKSGINIKAIHVNLSGQDVLTKHSLALVPLAEKGNKVITFSDIQEVNEQARILGSHLEEEIIHQISQGYTIDSQESIRNPIGLYSHKLGVDLLLVCGKHSTTQNLIRLAHQAGFEIKDIFLSGLATSRTVMNDEMEKGKVVFCDVGADITELFFFEDGLICDIDILETAGNGINESLALALKIPPDLAEEVKNSYGVVGDYALIKEDKEALVKKGSFYKPIKQKLICQIVTEQAKIICQKIKQAVEKNVPGEEVGAVIVVGRTLLLDGFLECLENTLSIPTRIGKINNHRLLHLCANHEELSGMKYLNYLTALGMICEAMVEKNSRGLPLTQSAPKQNLLRQTINRVKEVYQEYF